MASRARALSSDTDPLAMSWIDLKVAAALGVAGTVIAYAIAQEDAGGVLLGVGMIAASAIVWVLYRRRQRRRREALPPTSAAPLPRPAELLWLTFWVLLMIFMAWTIYRFQY